MSDIRKVNNFPEGKRVFQVNLAHYQDPETTRPALIVSVKVDGNRDTINQTIYLLQQLNYSQVADYLGAFASYENGDSNSFFHALYPEPSGTKVINQHNKMENSVSENASNGTGNDEIRHQINGSYTSIIREYIMKTIKTNQTDLWKLLLVLVLLFSTFMYHSNRSARYGQDDAVFTLILDPETHSSYYVHRFSDPLNSQVNNLPNFRQTTSTAFTIGRKKSKTSVPVFDFCKRKESVSPPLATIVNEETIDSVTNSDRRKQENVLIFTYQSKHTSMHTKNTLTVTHIQNLTDLTSNIETVSILSLHKVENDNWDWNYASKVNGNFVLKISSSKSVLPHVRNVMQWLKSSITSLEIDANMTAFTCNPCIRGAKFALPTIISFPKLQYILVNNVNYCFLEWWVKKIKAPQLREVQICGTDGKQNYVLAVRDHFEIQKIKFKKSCV